jgi:hypothetical protein
MGLRDIVQRTAKKTILPLAILASSLGMAQEADTAFGEGSLVFRNIDTFNPIENLETNYSALEMEDTVPSTVFTGTSDADGKVPYEVPVCIDSTVGIKDLYKDKVKVFPTPGSDMNIELPQELSGNYTLQVSDMSGRQVLTRQFTGNQEYVSLEHLAEGMYVYNLQTNGKTVAAGKTVKTNTPATGPASYQGPKSNNQAKDLSDCEAVYQINYDAPDGYVDGSTEVTITDGSNPDIDIFVTPWDTAYAYGNILPFDETENSAMFVPLTLTPVSMEEVFIDGTYNPEIVESGIGSSYENIPVAVNTQGNPATTNATYQVTWPFTPLPGLDSSDVDIDFDGWEAGQENIELEPGNNGNKFITLQRSPLPENYAKRFIEGYIGRLKNGAPGSENTPAEGAIVVIGHDQGVDTAYVDVNGYFISPQAYDNGEQLHIGAGYPGGQDSEGNAYAKYRNIEYTVEGASLLDMATGDTTKIYKMNLMPKQVWSGMDEIMVDMTAAQFQEMYQQPHYHNAVFDTVAFYVNTDGMGPNQISRIYEVAENMTNWTPLTYFEIDTPIENASPYDPETATATSHGSNVLNGDNNITNIQFTPANIQGNNSSYISAQVNVSGNLPAIYKELGFQRNAADDVGSRTSVMNSAGNIPNNLDIAIISQKHHLDKEMYSSSSTPNVLFDYQNQTQNISPTYLSDGLNITPQ